MTIESMQLPSDETVKGYIAKERRFAWFTGFLLLVLGILGGIVIEYYDVDVIEYWIRFFSAGSVSRQ